MRFQDISGKRFGSISVIKHHSQGRQKNGAAFNQWECVCDCGEPLVVRGEYLKYGNKRSCLACSRKTRRQGGLTPTEIGNIWSGVLARCYDKSGQRRYRRYAGRGIKMCERWRESLPAFAADMGPRPSPGHSVDRINNDGHYSCGKCDECLANGWPTNCRWATMHEQILNSSHPRFIEHEGESLCLSEWARRIGISREAMRLRLNRAIRNGQPPSYAITMTPSPGGKRSSDLT